MPDFYTERKAHWEDYLNLMFDSITGEAIAINVVDDGVKIYVPTGYFFERVTQSLPADAGNLDGARALQKVQPWGFATRETAEQVAEQLRGIMPNVGIAILEGDANVQFPLSHKPLELAIASGRQAVRRSAGLLAQTFARYTTIDPETGKMRRSTLPVRLAADEIAAELQAAPEQPVQSISGASGIDGAEAFGKH